MLDVRGTDSYLHQIEIDRDGTTFLQNGLWDSNILCATHEECTQNADKFAVEFCRNVVAEIPQVSGTPQTMRAKPDLLEKFAYQTIWRFCASQKGRGLGVLGPYGRAIEGHVFGNRRISLPILIARNHLKMPNGTESSLVVAPFPTRLAHWRCWLFSVGGVQFYVKLDKRPFPIDWRTYEANATDPVRLFQLDAMKAFDVPILQPLMKRMTNRR